MSVEVIRGNRNSVEVRFCMAWLEAASELREILHAEGQGFDPFSYNETATVGFLTAAAGRAQFFALPEFTEDNRKLPEGRVRAGRCDLWLARPDWKVNWLLEFKLFKFGPRSHTGLIKSLNEAISDAFHRDRQEAGERWGCVVYTLDERWDDLSEEDREAWKSIGRIETLADEVELAFRFDDLAGPAYLLMKRIPQLAKKLANHQINVDSLDPVE